MKRAFIIPILAVSFSFGAEHIIPPEWDNTLNSIGSKAEVLIHNNLPTLSASSYLIAGKNVKYRCVQIPKILCHGGYTADIKTVLKQAPSLRDTAHDELINAYSIDIRVESASATVWNVCAAAVGSVTWDKSELKQDAAKKNLVYSYIPNTNQLAYYFFTNAAGNIVSDDGISGGDIKGSPNSYMIIQTEQICK